MGWAEDHVKKQNQTGDIYFSHVLFGSIYQKYPHSQYIADSKNKRSRYCLFSLFVLSL